jgi:hypothetical protein
MAENKKSFVLYCDLIHTIEKMPPDKAGLLFLHILRYVNDMDPVTDNLLIELTFEPIKQQLKRDLNKYFKICEKNKNNGILGGRPPKENPKEPKKPNGLFNNPTEPKKPDSDTDSDTVFTKGNLIDFETSKKEAFNNYTMRNKICRLYNVSEKQVDELLSLFFDLNEVDYPKTWNDTEKHILRWVPFNIGKNSKILPEEEKPQMILHEKF